MKQAIQIKILILFLFLIPIFSMAQWLPTNRNGGIKSISYLTQDSMLIAHNGYLFFSFDGGVTFDSIENYPQQTAYNIEYKSKDTLFVARENTKGLLCSYNGGQTWFTQSLIMPNGDTAFKNGQIGFFGFFDDSRGIIFGDTLGGVQQVFLTDNGGLSWYFYTDSSIIQNVKFSLSYRGYLHRNNYVFSNGTGKFLVTADTKLLSMSNFGKHWTIDTLLTPDSFIYSITFKDDQHGLANISLPNIGPRVHQTTDGGKTWVQLPGFYSYSAGDLLYVKGTVNHSGFYLASTLLDRGESWASYDEGHTWQLFDTFNHGGGNVFFRNAERGMCAKVVFGSLSIYYYKLLNTGLNDLAMTDNNKSICYPNPAHQRVLFDRILSRIELRELQGRLMVSETQTNQLDISLIPSGLYLIYTSDDNNSISIQKLLIQH
jgi:photosystem II stability/assembly factor-like uncharacterized protein